MESTSENNLSVKKNADNIKTKKVKLSNEQKYMVTKSNSLISAKYRLSLQEQRFILILIASLNPDDEDFKNYQIRISDLKQFFNSKNLYKRVKNLTDRLTSKNIKIKTSTGMLQAAWLADAQYFDGKGYVEVSISRKLKPYLLQLKRCFTSFYLSDVLSLRSTYSIRIYELLIQFEKIRERIFNDLNVFKQMIGIGEGKYPKFKQLKQRVLMPAQHEIQKEINLTFDFESIKTGQKITGIRFFNINPKGRDNNPNKLSDDNDILRQHNLKSDDKRQLVQISKSALKNFDADYIQSNLMYAIEKSSDNLPGYFTSSLKNDWGKSIRSEQNRQATTQREKEKKIAIAKKLKAKIANMKNPCFRGYPIEYISDIGVSCREQDGGSRCALWADVSLDEVTDRL